ncbi:MAG TPA: hypothetical protein OIM45_02145 [Clostridiaceae bacterium]|nr:hypothetical protein [Clostridiaceae bacterium]
MEYIIGGFIVGVFIVVVFFFLKKENQKLEEMVANLNEEQKNELSLTDVKFIEGKNDEWIQNGMIGEMVDKGNKFAIKVLWHNRVIQNATYDQIQYGVTSLSKEEVEKNGLKVGDFVKVYIAPAKTSGSFKIIL